MTIAWQVDAPTVTTASDAALVLNDISKVYGEGALAVQALRGVSLTVRPGELVAVMGPSGSGKSSLLQIAGGLDVPSAGSVGVAGTNLIGLSPGALASVRRRRIGYVFQSLNLISSLTAVENVALPLELDGSSVRLARGAARAALVDVGLEAHIDKFPSELSGGQQQRVAPQSSQPARASARGDSSIRGNADCGDVPNRAGERRGLLEVPVWIS